MDSSLYHLALTAEPAPPQLSVSPATLKSMVGAMIDVLIEKQLPATLWVKLPPGKAWLSELELYQQQIAVPHTIYLCNWQTPMTELEKGKVGSIFPIQLPATSQLRQDYFMLVLSAQFCGVIIAHRPRQFKMVPSSNQKPTLLALCAFDGQTVLRVLGGIKQAMYAAVALSYATPSASAADGLKDLLARWDSLFALPSVSDPMLISQVLAKQWQRQEQFWRLTRKHKNSSLNYPGDEERATTEAQTRKRGDVENDQIPPLPSRGNTTSHSVNTLTDSLRLQEEFLSHLVQELRMPLTNMKTALTLLGSAQLKPAQRQRYMQLLHIQCDRQNSLLTGLLELLQLEHNSSAVLQPLHLIDIVPAIVSTYQPLAQEKGIQLGYTVADTLPVVSCLETWLRHIVINLLHNSIKYTPAGGQVSVQAKLQGDYVQLEFRDTGLGIAPSEIPKIFDPFYRGRPALSEDIAGAGLGLTIVHQLLLLCGGSISVTSKLGEGSIFKVLLPVAH